MAKSLFIFLFFSLSFGLTTQERSVGECHILYHMLGSHKVTSHNKSHDECGKIIHRPYSTCIKNRREFYQVLLVNLDLEGDCHILEI